MMRLAFGGGLVLFNVMAIVFGDGSDRSKIVCTITNCTVLAAFYIGAVIDENLGTKDD